MQVIHHLINGQAVHSAERFETLNPATQAPLAEVARGGEAEVHAAVAAAKAAFPGWAARPATERARIMHRLGELIAAEVPSLAQTESQDTGQVIAQTAKQLVPRAADNFHYFAEMCVRVDGHTYPTPTHLNYTLFHPVGVCALISPWNVPFMTATWKVAPCLAFGNTAVLKMSELSPLTASRLGELALQAGVPAGVLNVVHGHGREAGEPLVAHPDVRAISFTGSTATGNRIVQSAGLKKFSMELGGKSPFVVFDDADPERALDAAVFMIFSNNGERCTAGSRILVQRSIYARFCERFAERARAIRVGDPLDEHTVVGPMISAQHLAKVRHYIALGSQEGASLLCGGLTRPGYAPELPAALQAGNFVWPTVFADVDNRMQIAQDEIFGPVACLIPFDDEADAIRIANDTAYGLSSYVWTENIGRAHRVAAAIEAGMCFVNSQNVRDLRQPFGGTKASGTGREGGTWSYELFLEPKNVAVSLGAHPITRWGLGAPRQG
ncbi:MAG: 5-carboxymethyl-2-hydroxymuconate semialdehyde dehydrogenase [Rubrivivax sp.]